MALKYTIIFHSKAFKNIYVYPNLDFWFENTPSENPDCIGAKFLPTYLLFKKQHPDCLPHLPGHEGPEVLVASRVGARGDGRQGPAPEVVGTEDCSGIGLMKLFWL
jgi:hypothetical protein